MTLCSCVFAEEYSFSVKDILSLQRSKKNSKKEKLFVFLWNKFMYLENVLTNETEPGTSLSSPLWVLDTPIVCLQMDKSNLNECPGEDTNPLMVRNQSWSLGE